MTQPSTTDGQANVDLARYAHPQTYTAASERPGYVDHADPILHERHDYRDWVEWPDERGPIPLGARVRWEYRLSHPPEKGRYYIHPDDVPTDPDAELVERIANRIADPAPEYSDLAHYYRTCARGLIAIVRDHDKADR